MKTNAETWNGRVAQVRALLTSMIGLGKRTER